MNRTQEIITQTAQLTRQGLNSYEIEKVFKAARVLHRIHERQCNGYVTFGAYDTKTKRNERIEDTKAAERDEKREARTITQIDNILKPHGIEWEVQGDPRGAPITINGDTTKDRFSVWG